MNGRHDDHHLEEGDDREHRHHVGKAATTPRRLAAPASMRQPCTRGEAMEQEQVPAQVETDRLRGVRARPKGTIVFSVTDLEPRLEVQHVGYI